MAESIFQQVFTALNLVILERLSADSFQIASAIPDWYKAFFSELANVQFNPIQDKHILGEVFPFLDNFLIDAEAFWQSGDRRVLKSGFWSETNLHGQECQLEATAICGNPRPILLIELARVSYEEKHNLIQAGRVNELSHARLAKEIEKKEILLHCIFHDLAGQVTIFRWCLELLAREPLSDRGRRRLDIGLKQVHQQEELMREIVQVFSDEVAEPHDALHDPAQAPDLLLCAQSVVSTFLPVFLMQNKQIQMQVKLDPTQGWQVVGERSRLERVLTNLLENALRHTPEHTTVTLILQEEGQFLRCAIEDEGTGVPLESVKYLFQRFFQGKAKTGKAGLGLYFCRITVEQWGGTIGYSPAAAGGAQFWLHLRKFYAKN